MNATIKKAKAVGTAIIPSSKSYAHRALISASFAKGQSAIYDVDECEDVLATLDCLTALKIGYKSINGTYIVNGIPIECIKKSDERIFNCRESGSTLRFFIPIALAVGGRNVFNGTQKLFSRGLTEYVEICKEHGITFDLYSDKLILEGKLSCGHFKVDGSVSSQFVSGLLFASSIMQGESIVEITSQIVSSAYIDLTIDVLNKFGAKIARNGNIFVINGGLLSSIDITIERDWSNSAFFIALNFLGGNVEIPHLNFNSLQSDKVCMKYFEMLGDGFAEIDISSCPDLAPILFAFASVKHGGKFTGTKRLAVKESSRAEVMAQELAKIGANVNVFDDEVVVNSVGIVDKISDNVIFSGHNDHRIVMALSIISTIFGAKITGIEAVKKSFPDFFVQLERLGIDVVIN